MDMKYLFVLGRNIELSKAEVLTYFEKEKNRILNYNLIKNGLLIDLENEISQKIVDSFGGVVSVGKVLAFGNSKEIQKKLDKINLYSGTKNKLNYVLWNFSEGYETIQNYLKERFREEKLKATFKHLTGSIKLQDGETVFIPSSNLIDEEYFVFGKKEISFGKIISTCDYVSLEKRDMEKPFRRESLAISPRLAKILINLSYVKNDEILLDPFCGVGTILSEALIRGIKVIGIDKDKNAVNGSIENLRWFKFNSQNYELINDDSSRAKISGANVIVTEPDLGETLKKIPPRKIAEETLLRFENLIVRVINNFKGKVSGRVVFTSPYIRIGKKRLKCNIEKIVSSTGYKMIYEIPEYRENQIVGRMIYVLGK